MIACRRPSRFFTLQQLAKMGGIMCERAQLPAQTVPTKSQSRAARYLAGGDPKVPILDRCYSMTLGDFKLHQYIKFSRLLSLCDNVHQSMIGT
jgi:hypothetical protein